MKDYIPDFFYTERESDKSYMINHVVYYGLYTYAAVLQSVQKGVAVLLIDLNDKQKVFNAPPYHSCNTIKDEIFYWQGLFMISI